MTRNLWLAAVLVAAVSACVAVTTVAQDEGPGGQGGQGGPGGRSGRSGMGGPMMGGGGAAMVALKDHLYVLSGPRLLKIDPEQMKVVAELEISGGGMGGPGGQGGPGGRRGPRPGEGEGEEK